MSQAKIIQAPKASKSKPLTAERLRELLHYDPETGIWRWRIRPHNKSARRPGDIAGCTSKVGYWTIGIDYRVYKSHRLAFLFMTGKWPKWDVDHKDGVPGHDWWSNLREATESQNCMNKKRQPNSSGLKGVCWNKSERKWQATIMLSGKSEYLGVFDDKYDAHAAYRNAALKKFGPFARFD